LFIGTKADNNADMRAKGRNVRPGSKCGLGKYKRGERHHAAKLTEADVIAIRKDRATGLSYTKLAQKHGLSVPHAWKVCNKLWSHVRAG
jgi:hypothetical protein